MAKKGIIVVNKSNVNKDLIEDYVKSCPFKAIVAKDGSVDVDQSACKICRICAKKFADVFKFQEIEEEKINKDEWVGITVFIEHDGNKIHPVSLELIGKSKELAKVTGHPVYALLFSDDANKFTDTLLAYGVDKVYSYEHKLLGHFNVEYYVEVMADFVSKVKPSTILYGGTAIGRSFAPRVAARLKTGLTADCTILDMKKNTDLVQNRPAFGGNIMAGIICENTRPQMATVRYKIFKMPEKVKPFGVVEKMSLKDIKFKTNMRLVETKEKPKEIDISEADTIVCIGKPFKTKEQIQMAKEFADLIGAQLACTRPLVEAGVMPATRQIGLSGRTVSPKLLICLGISGAVQFTAGMKGSEVVFAVNNDKNAAIFDFVHYGLVGDIFTILPELIKTLKGEEDV